MHQTKTQAAIKEKKSQIKCPNKTLKKKYQTLIATAMDSYRIPADHDVHDM